MPKALPIQERKEIAKIFTNKYYEIVYGFGTEYVAQLILAILKPLSFFNLPQSKYFSIPELINELGLSEKTKYPFEWMLRFLGERNYIEIKEAGHEYLFRMRDKGISIDPRRIRDQIIKKDKEILPSCNFMELVAQYYPDFLRGNIKGNEVLFMKDKMKSWNAYFSNLNNGYVVYNQFGAMGVLKWFPRIDESITLLEIGTGTGNASILVLDKLRQNNLLHKIANFVLSDISSTFLRESYKSIFKLYGKDLHISMNKIDFNLSLIAQNIPLQQIDIVYGVNSLHVANDLFYTVKEIFKILKPGGMLIVSECVRTDCRDTLVQEIIFNMLENYLDVKLDGQYRNVPGFLTIAQWIKLFNDAGFVDVDYMVDADRFCENDLTVFPAHALILKGVKR